MQTVLQEEKIVKTVEVFNVAGAGGTVGLARLATTEKGKGDILMTMGAVMVGAILTNKSPVGLDKTTPIARLTA
ncbi:MAG: tripartite tricarboxylate transporter substrate binding protein, partial [Candidatus Binatia bacterium]